MPYNKENKFPVVVLGYDTHNNGIEDMGFIYLIKALDDYRVYTDLIEFYVCWSNQKI